MKALSLWQPWATAIALGSKTIETRHWDTSYRGPLAIHAAQRRNVGELKTLWRDAYWKGALFDLTGIGASAQTLLDKLPFGAIVATCYLEDCRRSESFTPRVLYEYRYAKGDHNGKYPYRHDDLGNFGPERFGFVLSNITPLVRPVPWKGNRKFFEVPNDIHAIAARLKA